MKIFNARGKPIDLKQNDYLAEGGEGKLFKKRDKVYKIYHDPQHMLPLAKIDELQQLKRDNIVAPLWPVFNNQGIAIGFCMRAIVNAPYALPRLFSNHFWQHNGFHLQKALHLLQVMQDTIQYIHQQGFLQIDGNEFNYLVSRDFRQVHFIDVDSYQSPGFPAQAIMPSIRDYAQLGFNDTTDWFSFAVVAFQLMVGIHPFKGRHPDYKIGDFAGRIKANLSVLNPAVRCPASVRDFNRIPKPYYDWFHDLFENGERYAPPQGVIQAAVTVRPQVKIHNQKVHFKAIGQFAEEIRRFTAIQGRHLVLTDNYFYNGRQAFSLDRSYPGVVLFQGQAWLVGIQDETLHAYDPANKRTLSTGLQAQELMVANNTVYLVNGDQLLEVAIHTMGGRMVFSTVNSRNILAHASQLFDGLVMQNIFGGWHLMLPAGPGKMPMVAVPELQGQRVIYGRYENHVAMIQSATDKGEYQFHEIRFSEEFDEYRLHSYGEDDFTDAFNFTVLDKGVMVKLVKQGEILVSKNHPADLNQRLVKSDNIDPQWHLTHDGNSVFCYQGTELYRMSLNQ